MAPPLLWLRAQSWRAAGLGMLAAVLLLAWAVLAPSQAIAAGWLIGFLFWLGIAVGALTLLAIHALTGGRWGLAARPALAPAAATLPVFGLFGLPLVLALQGLFPWVTNPAAAAPGVADHYLNPAGWIGRAAIAMLGWSLLAVLLLRGTRTQRLTAGLGLCFHAVIVTLIGIDWVLSVAPRFYSTAFGMGVATMQILSALAWVAALRIMPPGGAGKAGDIGGLIIAAALGSLYLGFSQYLVIWYGDIPQRVTWYLDRQSGIWPWIDIAAMALCGLLPFFVLMRQRWRNSPAVLAAIGACVLAGLLLHIVWLLAPAFGLLTLLSAPLAFVAIGALWVALAYGLLAPRLETAHGA